MDDEGEQSRLTFVTHLLHDKLWTGPVKHLS